METIISILRFDLRPWLDKNNQQEDYYSPELRLTPSIREEYIPRFKTDFNIPAFSIKIKYYERLIDNNITDFINNIIRETEDESDNLIAFKLKKAKGRIKSLMTEINDLILLKDYDLNLIASKHSDFSADRQHKEATFIFQYMLTALIKCYLEIQYHFSTHIHEDDIMGIADIYSLILNRPAPEYIFIHEVQTLSIAPVEIKNKAKYPECLSFTYTKLKKESSNINDLFNSLKLNKSITEDTTITDFKHVFSGVPVSNPVKWCGAKGDLPYLFKLLNKEYKVLTFPGNSIWKIVCECFVDKDGQRFTEQSLRDQKQPKITKENIIKAAKLMK